MVKSQKTKIMDSIWSHQFSSVTQLCPTLCDPVNSSMPGLPVHYQLPEFTQTHVHRVGDAIQPSHPLSSPSPPAPITSWQIDRKQRKVSDFIFLGSKTTAGGDCSHEIKRCLLLGRKVMTNLDSILKSRDIILPTKVHLVKALVFLVVMYGCESWTIKKSWAPKNWSFELWCWRRLLRVPWTARRSNQSILKEISPKYSLEGMMLKLKLQCCPPDAKNRLIGKDCDAGKDWMWEEKGTTEDEMVRRHHRLNGLESEWTPGVGDRQGGLVCYSPCGREESDMTERLNWTDGSARKNEEKLECSYICYENVKQCCHWGNKFGGTSKS